jgi:hypothetical protein
MRGARPPWRNSNVGWAAASGLVAAILNALAIAVVQSVGVKAGTGGLARFVALRLDRAFGYEAMPQRLGIPAQQVFHATVGVVAALLYAAFFYEWLPGPRWLRGIIYSQTMWLVQGLIVLPGLGKGLFGGDISPAAPVWSWLLNALYGLVLGWMYRPLQSAEILDSTAP